MPLEITMRHIRALAGKRGYRVMVDDSHLHIIQKRNERVKQSFDIHAPFMFDPSCTQQFTFICVYFWVRGYCLSYEENKTIRIERAEHHPESHEMRNELAANKQKKKRSFSQGKSNGGWEYGDK